jgi:CubicO group peptidase (beta-lactamase class C family)
MRSAFRIDRRAFVASLGCAMADATAGTVAAASPDWQIAPPQSAGFDAQIDARIDKLAADKRIWGMHGIVVTRGRKLVYERYFEGADAKWGEQIPSRMFTPDTLHDLRSVSKSILSLLYGIALAQGKVPAPETPLLSLFPKYADLAKGREDLRVAHVLTMTMGLDWDESSVPYSNPANSEIAMETAPDRYRFVLERGVLEPPGRHWIYSGGATALLGHILAQGTGKSLPDFAREHLFQPLGITEFEWIKGADGVPSAASGLRLTARNVATIGHLMLARGAWDGRQVVPRDWIEAAVAPKVAADEARRFGYHWYSGYFSIAPRPDARFRQQRMEPWWGAFGNGGQRLFVLPDLDLTIVTTAGNYSTPDQWVPPIRVVREAILPSLL